MAEDIIVLEKLRKEYLDVLAVNDLNLSIPPGEIFGLIGRVEMWRGGLGGAYRLSGPFVCRCLTSSTLLRFHIPLIEPDRRVSRIRLSDQASWGRTRPAVRASGQQD
jgi:hypothetical protein